MGIFDLPSPVLSWIDGQLMAFLPPVAKLLLWAAIAALGSMELYRVLSPQRRIRALEVALRDTQRSVGNHEGSFADGWWLIRAMLGLAFRRVLLVLPATLIASLPLLVLIVWLDSAYGSTFPPPGESISVVVPGDFQGRWIAETEAAPPRAQVVDRTGKTVASISLAAPVPAVHKHRWWNVLIGNPAGYLQQDAPVDRIEIGLPRQEVLPFGPDWLRGWEVGFFVSLVVLAWIVKVVRRIE